MRAFIIFSIILLIFLAGCTSQVVKTGVVEKPQQQVATNETNAPFSKPQITSTEGSSQESKVTAATSVETTKSPEEPTKTPESKTYQVNVVEGIGIREGSG